MSSRPELSESLKQLGRVDPWPHADNGPAPSVVRQLRTPRISRPTSRVVRARGHGAHRVPRSAEAYLPRSRGWCRDVSRNGNRGVDARSNRGRTRRSGTWGGRDRVDREDVCRGGGSDSRGGGENAVLAARVGCSRPVCRSSSGYVPPATRCRARSGLGRRQVVHEVANRS